MWAETWKGRGRLPGRPAKWRHSRQKRQHMQEQRGMRGLVYLWDQLWLQYHGHRVWCGEAGEEGREAGTHLYAMMGFGICPAGNLKSFSVSDQGWHNAVLWSPWQRGRIEEKDRNRSRETSQKATRHWQESMRVLNTSTSKDKERETTYWGVRGGRTSKNLRLIRCEGWEKRILEQFPTTGRWGGAHPDMGKPGKDEWGGVKVKRCTGELNPLAVGVPQENVKEGEAETKL